MENTPQTEQDLENQMDEVNTNEELPEESPESFETINGTEGGKLEVEISKLQDELAGAKEKYLRLYSEFENFRRRSSKEKLEMIQSANENLIQSLIPVMDDFERAEKAFQGIESKEMEGFVLIFNKFKKTLEQTGVKIMAVQTGSDFDADFHEAISQLPAPEDKLKGKVIDVVEKGYLLNDKVIRYAKVVVGQ